MPFPTNISKEHLKEAIEKIDKEGFPNDADSQYYDVSYNDKFYPPKVVVSYANIFANGIELPRNTFSGGLNTPCFKLLESNGFTIRRKNNSTGTMKVKIYEVKTSSAENASKLLSPDGKYFYWNNTRFLNNENGNVVFFVNRTAGWALYTKLSFKDIATTQNRETQTASFNHEYNTYIVADKDAIYNLFYRFDVLSKMQIPNDWNWTRQLGQSETYDLMKAGLEGDVERISKIDDLEKLFPESDAYETLEECRNFLSINSNKLIPEIVEALQAENIQQILKEQEFTFQLAQNKFKEFTSFAVPNHDVFYKALLDTAQNELKFDNLLARFAENTNEKKLIVLIGEVIAYCDDKARNKHVYNEYTPPRTLANSFVQQNVWVNHLLMFKQAGNNINAFTLQAIKSAIQYFIDPASEINMLSQNHRKMVAKYLLKTDYDQESFVRSITDFFTPYPITPVNPLNFTRIISLLLYNPKVKILWFERVEGLVAIDTTNWMDDALKELKPGKKIVFWWSRVPSSRARVDRLLQETLKQNKCFYFYILQKNNAVYRAKVIDYAYEENYGSKKWNNNNHLLWYADNFSEYKGASKTAEIVFLVDEFVKLNVPIPVDKFQFYNETQPPRQFNLQPYSELNWEAEEIETRNVWFVAQGMTYTQERGMKFLWAPTKGQDGQTRFYWDNVLKVKKGDIIFNYSEGIKGVSIASSDGYKSKNEDPASPWGSEGFRVDISLSSLDPIIHGSLLANKKAELDAFLSSNSYKPFNTNGGVNQGYLYEFTKEAGRFIRDLYGKTFGNKIIDDFFDEVASLPNTDSKKTMEYRTILNAIKTKPFILLAGISGTGKSRLVRTLAYNTCSKAELRIDPKKPGNFELIPVRPNWHDSSELMGYVSRINGEKYIITSFLKFIAKAWKHRDVPFFLCLDEMNLAPVEQYFAEYLSIIETRQIYHNDIGTDYLLSKASFENPNLFTNTLEELGLANDNRFDEGIGVPTNLIVIGTVNMDETTHSFSRKVLDRAMTFEMNEVDLSSGLDSSQMDWSYPSTYIDSKDVVGFYTAGCEVVNRFNNSDEVIKFLQNINNGLENTPFKIAYRVRDEFLIYCYYSSLQNPDANWLNLALDDMVIMKILSRIEGDESKTGDVLKYLLNNLSSDFKKSIHKLNEMQNRLQKSGYTTYWS